MTDAVPPGDDISPDPGRTRVTWVIAGAGFVAVVVAIGALMTIDGDGGEDGGEAESPTTTITEPAADEVEDTVPTITEPAADEVEDTVASVDGASWPAIPADVPACESSAVAHDSGLFTNRGGPSWIGVILTNISPTTCALEVDAVQWDGRTPDGEFATEPIAHSATGPDDVDAVDPILESGESGGIRLPFLVEEGDPGATLALRITTTGAELDVYAGLEDAPAVTSGTGLHSVPDALVESVFATTDPGSGQPVEPGQVISTAGLGAIRAGSTLQEVADATGTPVWAFEWNHVSLQCGHAQLGARPRQDLILHLLGESLDLSEATVTAVVTTSPDFATPSGIRVGDPESVVLDRLDADRLERFPNEYTDGHRWRFTPESPDERHLGVTVSIEDGEVVSIGGGLNGDGYRLEGCA